MPDRKGLFEEEENAEQVSVRTDGEVGTVEVELEGAAVEFYPDEVRSLSEPDVNDPAGLISVGRH